MGKQIEFYMSEKKQMEFVKYLFEDDFIFLDYYSEILNREVISDFVTVYLYKRNYGEIVMNHHAVKALELNVCPIIEFSKTSITEQKKIVHRGRLWMEDRYYASDKKLVKKDEQFIKDYQKLVRWIKKNVPYQQIKMGDYIVKEYINDEIIKLKEKGYILSI